MIAQVRWHQAGMSIVAFFNGHGCISYNQSKLWICDFRENSTLLHSRIPLLKYQCNNPYPLSPFRLNPPHRLHPSPSLHLKPIHTRLAHFPLHLRSNCPFWYPLTSLLCSGIPYSHVVILTRNHLCRVWSNKAKNSVKNKFDIPRERGKIQVITRISFLVHFKALSAPFPVRILYKYPSNPSKTFLINIT